MPVAEQRRRRILSKGSAEPETRAARFSDTGRVSRMVADVAGRAALSGWNLFGLGCHRLSSPGVIRVGRSRVTEVRRGWWPGSD